MRANEARADECSLHGSHVSANLPCRLMQVRFLEVIFRRRLIADEAGVSSSVTERVSSFWQDMLAYPFGLKKLLNERLKRGNRSNDWYATIMKSFEERYIRSMKTCALVISLLMVIVLNANPFGIYRQISGNDQMRDQLVNAGQQISQKLDAQRAAGQTGTAQTDATIKQVADESVKDIQENVAVYTSFGFEGPRWIAGVWKNPTGLWSRGTAETILGWLVMTALLSVGAPFWQDVLASLFGLKNLLNKPPPHSETK